MKTKQVGKKILSGLLTVCLVAGSIAITKPQKANAAEGNLVANGGFDTTADWYNTSGNTEVTMPEQQEIEEIEVIEHFPNGDFENASFDYSSVCWTDGTAGYSSETEDDGNRVYHVKELEPGRNFFVSFSMEANKTYTISFDIKATAEESAGLFHLFDRSSVLVQAHQVVNSEWERYTYDYTPKEAETGLIIQNVEEAKANIDFYIDNFSVTTEQPRKVAVEHFPNGDFEDEILDYSTVCWTDGNGSYARETDTDGNGVYHVKELKPNGCFSVLFSMEANKTYTISFDIKATAEESAGKFHVFNEGWESVKEAQEINAEWKRYTYDYTPTKAETVLIFQNVPGAETSIDFYIDNFSVTTLEEPRMVEVEQIPNGDFENASYDYAQTWWSQSGLNFGVEQEEGRGGVLHVQNFDGGKCMNVNVPLKAGKTYTISLDVKSVVKNAATDWVSYHLFDADKSTEVDSWQNAPSNGTWKTLTHTYTPKTDKTGFVFEGCEGGRGDFYIDNFSVTTEGPNAIEEIEHIPNRDFENESYDYTQTWWTDENGSYAVETEDDGNRVLHVKELKPKGCVYVEFRMEANKTYTISFDIKATATESAGLFHLFDRSSVLVKAHQEITTGWKRYTYEYTPTKAEIGLIFQNNPEASGNIDFYIDNFSVTTEQPSIFEAEHIPNGDFENASYEYTQTWWSQSGLNFGVEQEEGRGRVLHVQNFDGGKCMNVNVPLKAGKTYTISLDVKSVVKNAATDWVSYHLFDADKSTEVDSWQNAPSNGTWKTLTHTYTPKTDKTGFVFEGCEGGRGDFYIDNFSVISIDVPPTYSDGIGTCLGFEMDNVLAMKKMKEATYKNVSIAAGKRYTYSYQVKTDKAASVTFVVGEQNVQTVAATSEWTNVKGIFTAESDTTELSFVRSGEGSLLIDDIVVYEGIKEHEIQRYYNISNGDYLLTSSSGNLVVEENETLTAGDRLTINDLKDTNVFHISRIENGELWKETVVLYIPGDANEDEAISAKDLVAMKWAEVGTSEKQNARLAGTYAADLDRNGEVNDIDLLALRLALVSDDAKAELAVSKADSLLGGEMPIAGFDMPREGNGSQLINDEFYQKVADANINTIVWSFDGYLPNGYGPNADKHMALADQVGLKMLVHDYSTDAAQTDRFTDENFAQRVGRYSMYESFAGIHIVDEPDSDANPLSTANYEKKISIFKNDIDLCNSTANISGYVNYFPYYPQLFNQTEYQERYKTYLKEVYTDTKAEMLSVDHYPFDSMEYGGVWYRYENRQYLYQNLDMMRTEVNKPENAGKPFWSYAQLTIALGENEKMKDDNQYMTNAEVQWQVNTALAMGARGIQYWSVYAEPNYSVMANYKEGYAGLIRPDGEGSKYYDAVKAQNSFIKAIDEVLMNATNIGVFVKDSVASNGLGKTKSGVVLADKDSDVLKSVTGENALVGCFDYYGKNAFYVVNCNTDAAQDITLTYDNPCKAAVTEFGRAAVNREFVAEATSTTISVGAGQAALVIVD